jgi:hypothetical protein
VKVSECGGHSRPGATRPAPGVSDDLLEPHRGSHRRRVRYRRGSIALIGFGFDSSIEAFAASVVIWQLRGSASEERERRALRIFAVTFFVLAAYVIIDSIRDLIVGEQAGESTVGITLAIISLIVMPTLAWFKRRTGQEMGSAVLVADSAETYLCAWFIRHPAHRTCLQRHSGLVVGRPPSGARDCIPSDPRGAGGLDRR